MNQDPTEKYSFCVTVNKPRPPSPSLPLYNPSITAFKFSIYHYYHIILPFQLNIILFSISHRIRQQGKTFQLLKSLKRIWHGLTDHVFTTPHLLTPMRICYFFISGISLQKPPLFTSLKTSVPLTPASKILSMNRTHGLRCSESKPVFQPGAKFLWNL